MLFNLSQQRHFKNTGTDKEIFCRSDYGPYYGYGELAARDQPFNGYGNCESWVNKNTYNIPEDEDHMNMLTNKKDGYFTIT